MQIELAKNNDADLIGTNSYLKLVDRINLLDGQSQIGISKDYKKALTILRALYDISCLHITLNSFQEYQEIKKNEIVKSYSKAFKKFLNDLPKGNASEGDIFKSMVEAINTNSIKDKITGGINIAATITSVVSAFTDLGVTGTVGSFAAEGVNKLLNRNSKKSNWFMLVPEISKTLTKTRIEQHYKSLLEKKI
ncbi:MAG: hypothetical protein IH619_04835 [Ignavibacterium sp.]|nr:hypothetical protein [Ignavibacterium sp.]